MNIKEFKEAYPYLRKSKIVPYLWGRQGVGKTQTIKQIAKENNLDIICLNLATQEVGDLIGLLTRGPDGSVYHARPEWFPTEGNGIIFLDEINRAHPEVLQAMFPFILDGTLHRHQLPVGYHIVVAGNHNSSEFNVTDMSDAAWLSRFCHIDFKPSREEFLLYLENKENFGLASFIRDNPDCLESEGPKHDPLEFVKPDRRMYDIAISMLDAEDTLNESLRYELYTGCIGRSAASAYMSYRAKNERSISGKEVIKQYKKVRKAILEMSDTKGARFDMLNKTINEVILNLKETPKFLQETKTLNNVKDFILDLPNECIGSFMQKLNEEKFAEKAILFNDVDLCLKVDKKLNKSKGA